MTKPFSLLLIGGSAGALEPLKEILAGLPKEKTFAVVCVLHILGRQKSLLPEVYLPHCPWPVKDAESTEPIDAGTVYFAPSDYHLSLEKDRSFALSNEEPVMFSRPSIDLLFKSAAASYRSEAVALLLSGANSDGAQGLQSILRHGGRAYAQDPQTAEFKEMPSAALAASRDVVSVKASQVVDILNGRY